MIDPRQSVLEKRFLGIKKIVTICSSKGGVGKSSCSVVTALQLAQKGYKTGLFDMDFHGATDHLFLGIRPSFPEEEGGILPFPIKSNLHYMSIAPFTGEHGTPMRGQDITNAILELLAVTIWGELDYLIIDMPPGIGDELLDVLKYIPKSEILLVSTQSVVAEKVVDRLIELLDELPVTIIGIVYNLIMDNKFQRREHYRRSVRDLGLIRYDAQFENAIGNPEELLQSDFSYDIDRTVVAALLS